MKTFYVTFGQKYRTEQHPLAGPYVVHPDGVWAVPALDQNDASTVVSFLFGGAYSSVYEDPDFSFYPLGVLNTPIVPGDIVHPVHFSGQGYEQEVLAVDIENNWIWVDPHLSDPVDMRLWYCPAKHAAKNHQWDYSPIQQFQYPF